MRRFMCLWKSTRLAGGGTRFQRSRLYGPLHGIFLIPDSASSSRYLNWEFNPKGAMFLSFGIRRHDREDNYTELFQIKTEADNKGWRMEYCIPWSFLRRHFPAMEQSPGYVMWGNFYKCRDKTSYPHCVCWSPIDLPLPNFHCPDLFGDLIF
jgi:hypothetical protein